MRLRSQRGRRLTGVVKAPLRKVFSYKLKCVYVICNLQKANCRTVSGEKFQPAIHNPHYGNINFEGLIYNELNGVPQTAIYIEER